MRVLSFHILLMAVLVAAVTGCGGAHRYDGRLMAADSLMHDNPDSAMAIIQAVCPDSLTTEGDRAYRDLLLTQARYKCYIVATSDSDINRALAYYRQHKGEREKLTRAYIYKGAVMEELGHPDSAMYYYKTAEVNAEEKDYANLGYINTRIANLFRLYYGDEQICYEKYSQALKYHGLANNKRMQINSLYNMAGFLGITSAGKSKELLQQAFELALQEQDSLNCYLCQELLCRQLLMQDSTLGKAKQIGLKALELYPAYINYDLILDLAHIYVKESKKDSAYFFLSMINDSSDNSVNAQIKARKLAILSAITHQEGNNTLSYAYLEKSSHVGDSVLNNKYKYLIQSIENTNNSVQKSKSQNTISGLQLLIVGTVAIALILIGALLIYHYRRIHYIKSIIRELEHSKIDNHEDLLHLIDAKDSVIELFVQNMVAFMQQSIDATEKDSPAIIRRRLKESIKDVVNDDFWKALRRHLDKNYNNVITKIAQNPKIMENDLHFIELCCCGFNYVEIAITLGYSPNYISNKRKGIARKLGLKKSSLQEYLIEAMN